MAETHRAAVAYICGIPFAVTNVKTIATLLRISNGILRLQVKPDGSLATPSHEEAKDISNKMLTRVEVVDIECTECNADGEEVVAERVLKVDSDLGKALLAAFAKGRE